MPRTHVRTSLIVGLIALTLTLTGSSERRLAAAADRIEVTIAGRPI